MSLRVELIDGQGSGILAGVSPTGEMVVAGEGTLINQSKFQVMNATATAFNFFGPIPGQQFLITSVVFDGPANATITIYEASTPSTTTIDKTLFKVDIRVAGQMVIPFSFGGFLAVDEGEYVNALTDTATVNMNIVGYYHPIFTKPL